MYRNVQLEKQMRMHQNMLEINKWFSVYQSMQQEKQVIKGYWNIYS